MLTSNEAALRPRPKDLQKLSELRPPRLKSINRRGPMGLIRNGQVPARSVRGTNQRKVTGAASADRKRRNIAIALLRWSAAGHRRDFPWRSWKDPYRLLVAEVLLRQTRAETVAAFIPTFLTRYPSPRRLSLASELEIAQRLRPLGFSSQRAAQLRDLAARLVKKPGPLSQDQLRELPGIGPYSAGMVAAAMGTMAAAVDTNVARVLCRVFRIKPSHAEARKSHNVWKVAEDLVSTTMIPAEITWAMLDLASLLCKKRHPRCSQCPLSRSCFYSTGSTSSSGREVKRKAPGASAPGTP